MRTWWRTMAIILVVLGTSGPGRGQEAGAPVDESVEPPMLLTLEVGGSPHAIEIGKPLTLKTEEGETVVVLKAEDHRVFPYGGVRFHYPARFAFEAEMDDPSGTIWSLDGNYVSLMIQRFDGLPNHETCRREIARAMAFELGVRRPKTKETKTKFGGHELPGTHLDVAIGGSLISVDFYSLVQGGASVVLVLQDMLGEDGENTAEWKRTVEMLTRSFEIKGGR